MHKRMAVWVGIVAVIALLLSWNRLFPVRANAPLVVDPNTLPGIQTGDAPWAPEIAHLRARLSAIALRALPSEGSALHTHEHLDLFIRGTPTPVPADIGVNVLGGFIAPVHTHDASGDIHIESPTLQTFTLGQFFDVWGVRFTKGCIGGYCADASSTLAVYDNGALVVGDPRALQLAPHHEIAVVFGAASSTLAVPARHVFPLGE